MSRRVLARGRVACAWALVVAGVAGCTSGGAASSTVTATGKTLMIYLSNATTSQPRIAQDVLDAERLAFRQGPNSVGGFALQLEVRQGKISDVARDVIQDQSSIAYLGEVAPGSSSASLGITNAVDLLQVSPTDTALELTQATPAIPGAPDSYYESLSTDGQTFARVVPTTAREAKAQVQEMESLGVTKLYVASDGGPYGAAIAHALKQDVSGKISLAPSQSGADGIFYGSNSPAGAEHYFTRAAAANPSAKLFGPSALSDSGFASGLPASVRSLYVSSPGFLGRDLNPAGTKFVSEFTQAYGRDPVPQAIFGYEAMSAVLSVLQEAGAHANNRSTVVHDFLSIKNRQSAIGTYSMNSNGDTSIAPFVFSRLQGGRLVPFAQVEG